MKRKGIWKYCKRTLLLLELVIYFCGCSRCRCLPITGNMGFHSVFTITVSSMIMTCVNPHRLGFSRALESALAIKVLGTPIGNEHVLVKTRIARHQPPHKLRANPPALILWQDEQVRIIDDQVTV